LATELFGITFRKNTGIPVYHPEVEAFEVFDENNRFLAVLYTDFFPREGKRQGAWMTEYKGQWKVNGKDSRPHISLVMNFTRPTETKPALLTFDEVNTFLHEFGHSLHGMFADGVYESLSGTNVYRDFVELPSQLMENFLLEKAFLDRFAVHYLTGEKIPAGIVQKLIDAGNFNAGYACIRQLNFGYLDMAWHTLQTPYTGDISAFEQNATLATQVLPVIPGTCIGTSFNHIFSGGYAAGYYGYKWAEVLDADAYSVFKAHGVFSKTVAKKYRENILSKGGSEDPMTLYVRFKGDKPTIDALLERNGIKK
jgi:peptidyl-dipeptidase Dcp